MTRKQGVDLVPYQAESERYRQHPVGSLLEWQGYGAVGEPREGIEWRKNEPFEATLTVKGTFRGRSAARFVWVDDQNRTFPMFLVDVLETLRRGVAEGGTVTGTWLVAKRGANYGIRLADLVLKNDAQASSRTLNGPLPEGWRRVGSGGSVVQHLVDPPRENEVPGTIHGHYINWSICYQEPPAQGWLTGEKIEKRKVCVKCTDRFNYILERATHQ